MERPQVQAGFWTPPWLTPEPGEADLVERIVGMAAPRSVSINAAAVRSASEAVLHRRAEPVVLPAGTVS